MKIKPVVLDLDDTLISFYYDELFDIPVRVLLEKGMRF